MNQFSAWNLPWPVLQIPAYREVTLGGWALKKFEQVPQTGYFQDWQGEGELFALLEGEKSWMSTSWDEVDSQSVHVAAGHGHVVLMGAGMGVALFNLLALPQVRQVTLVELEPMVLDILEQSTQMSAWIGSKKLRVVLKDALDFSADQPVDHLYADIWATLGEEQTVAEMQAIQQQVNASSVGWWGQEIHFLEWLKQREYTPSISSYRLWATELGLPLIERDRPDYISGVMQVAKSYCYQSFLADPLRAGV